MSIEQGAVSVEAEAYLIRDARIYADIEGRLEPFEATAERLDQVQELFSSDLTDLQIIDLVEATSEYCDGIRDQDKEIPLAVEENERMLHTAIFILPRIDTIRAIRLYNMVLGSTDHPETASTVVNGLFNLTSIDLNRKVLNLWRKALNYPGNKASRWTRNYLKDPEGQSEGLLDEPEIEKLKKFGEKIIAIKVEKDLDMLEQANQEISPDEQESGSES